MKEAFFNFSQFSLPKFLLLFWHICPTFFWTIFKSTSPNQKGGFSFSFYPLLLVYFSGGFFFLVLFYFSNSLFTYSPTPIPFIRTLSPLYSDWFSFSLHSINSVSFQFAIQPSNSSNSYFFFSNFCTHLPSLPTPPNHQSPPLFIHLFITSCCSVQTQKIPMSERQRHNINMDRWRKLGGKKILLSEKTL